MEYMRPGLRHGDLTTTGGVITATGRMRFHGKEVAAEGDLATCPACKSMGYLVNDAYPAFGLPSGRQLAIQGAWIFCKCANPPRAIASTDKFRVAVNRAGSIAQGHAGVLPLSSVPSGAPDYVQQRESVHDRIHPDEEDIVEQYYELVDADTGQPVPGYRYDLLTNGKRSSQDAALIDGRSVIVRGGLSIGIVLWLDKSREAQA
ncbi:MAG: PAAR domain-containing protein [Ralstonia sp.]|jgi:uncharacterized Zn-binding protein involved in type VI secretion|uniref:PAAR domain-containing protein n=4 Tax=Pseudomonadota TaxID=1224 RepID=A0A2P4RHA5_RALPI|nr:MULTISPECIES: PAAR domain-containing protein [Ralstonia]MBA4202025.1 PAAR domain-containing protein [Ralstonia sp.]MBA4230892.1 PAAR domain-containing protein [Ralstonia sp.]MBA4235327.1 PAAR domain-containing protein [Ralstonia sp.]MBA4404536.1 PAAR domain-containing protein [Ralstonia sp.]MBA9847290.1 PAAR domain-containing protein [Ralstonia pickettii]